ncbi:unnamed protein product [Durusdinium trenchii]|uniref:Apple domain-containing protein n=1 Tax=Durusdinium trenchii TaxID=1381693 RepID=A0ABP0HFZ1_9DINO
MDACGAIMFNETTAECVLIEKDRPTVPCPGPASINVTAPEVPPVFLPFSAAEYVSISVTGLCGGKPLPEIDPFRATLGECKSACSLRPYQCHSVNHDPRTLLCELHDVGTGIACPTASTRWYLSKRRFSQNLEYGSTFVQAQVCLKTTRAEPGESLEDCKRLCGEDDGCGAVVANGTHCLIAGKEEDDDDEFSIDETCPMVEIKQNQDRFKQVLFNWHTPDPSDVLLDNIGGPDECKSVCDSDRKCVSVIAPCLGDGEITNCTLSHNRTLDVIDSESALPQFCNASGDDFERPGKILTDAHVNVARYEFDRLQNVTDFPCWPITEEGVHPGKSIGQATTTSWDTCAQKCLGENSTCDGFQYNEGTHHCTLHDIVGESTGEGEERVLTPDERVQILDEMADTQTSLNCSMRSFASSVVDHRPVADFATYWQDHPLHHLGVRPRVQAGGAAMGAVAQWRGAAEMLSANWELAAVVEAKLASFAEMQTITASALASMEDPLQTVGRLFEQTSLASLVFEAMGIAAQSSERLLVRVPYVGPPIAGLVRAIRMAVLKPLGNAMGNAIGNGMLASGTGLLGLGVVDGVVGAVDGVLSLAPDIMGDLPDRFEALVLMLALQHKCSFEQDRKDLAVALENMMDVVTRTARLVSKELADFNERQVVDLVEGFLEQLRALRDRGLQPFRAVMSRINRFTSKFKWLKTLAKIGFPRRDIRLGLFFKIPKNLVSFETFRKIDSESMRINWKPAFAKL